jgi:3',5'-nucleoside bisphosphate phosphatase
MRADLHIHTTASDGVFPPEEVVARARAGGLDVIAIADHDTIAGVAPAQAVAGPHLQVIPAIEISASHLDREVHVLGYLVDVGAPPMLEYTRRARLARAERIREMIHRLATLDVAVDFQAVVDEAGPRASSLARPHLARVLRDAGHVGSVSEAFERFIGDRGPAYVASRLLDAAAAIRLIHDAGGIAVWAHPPQDLLGSALTALVEAGLDGLECYRPRLPDADLKRLLRLARTYQLIPTGGSDWHGEWHGELGQFYLNDEQLAAFFQRATPA